MKQKRLFLFILTAIFIMVLFALFFITFTIKEVKITYACAERESDTVLLEQKLNSINGKNLLFVEEDDIKNVLSDFSFFEVVKVEKSFPSTLNISLRERHKAYYVVQGEKKVLLSDDGFVLSTSDFSNDGLIEFNFDCKTTHLLPDRLRIVNAEKGKKIETNFNEYFYSVLDYTKQINSTDRISGIEVLIYDYIGQFDIFYKTFSKVDIYISKANDLGIEKVKKAIKAYDEDMDFIKSSEKHELYCYKDNNGLIHADFQIKT